ncbi:MAG: hypothetical protein ACJ8MR_11140, partial [Povalibacter sp.]
TPQAERIRRKGSELLSRNGSGSGIRHSTIQLQSQDSCASTHEVTRQTIFYLVLRGAVRAISVRLWMGTHVVSSLDNNRCHPFTQAQQISAQTQLQQKGFSRENR